MYLIWPLSLRLSWMILLTKDSSPPSHTSSPGAPEWALRGKGLLDVLATFFGSNSSSELKKGGLHMQKLYTVSALSTPSSIVSSFTERTVQPFTLLQTLRKPDIFLTLIWNQPIEQRVFCLVVTPRYCLYKTCLLLKKMQCMKPYNNI